MAERSRLVRWVYLLSDDPLVKASISK